MRFHKGKFRIARVDNTIEFVEGWIDETNTYGFHKMMKIGSKCGEPRLWKWLATDIASGMRVCHAQSRAGCVVWLTLNEDLIAEKKNTEGYKNWVRDFWLNGRAVNETS